MNKGISLMGKNVIVVQNCIAQVGVINWGQNDILETRYFIYPVYMCIFPGNGN